MPPADNHVIYTWQYANTAARTGASGFVNADVGKVAWQTDDDTFWVLKATTPTWVSFGSGSGGSTTDPYWNNVVLAMRMSGSNGSATFTDLKGKTVTVGGNAQISTADSLFDGSSGLFDGAGDSLSLADSVDWAFGTGDLDFRFRFRPAALPTYGVLIDQWTSGSVGNRALQIYTNGSSLKADFELGGTVYSISGGALSIGVWQEAALIRYGSSIKLYLEGTSIGTPITSSAAWSDSNSPLRIGTFQDGSYGFNGKMCNLLVTKGVARDTTDYTPSATPFLVG